jgi:hypothetical protein
VRDTCDWRRCRVRFSGPRVAEPVIYEEEATRRGPKRYRRNGWHRSRGLRSHHVADSPLFVHAEVRESRATLSTRRRAPTTSDAGGRRDGCRASVGRSPGELTSILFQRCPAPERAARRTSWRCPPEASATTTKQAVESPGGGRDRPRTTNVTRHRRAASRNGGATSAERDGRPVERRTVSSFRDSGSVSASVSDSNQQPTRIAAGDNGGLTARATVHPSIPRFRIRWKCETCVAVS